MIINPKVLFLNMLFQEYTFLPYISIILRMLYPKIKRKKYIFPSNDSHTSFAINITDRMQSCQESPFFNWSLSTVHSKYIIYN